MPLPQDSGASQEASAVPLTALLPGKVIPGKEAIPLFPIQAIIVFRQATTPFLPRQAVRQAIPFPRTAWLPRKPTQSPLTTLLPGKAPLTGAISQEGSLGNTRSQAGNRLTSSQAVRFSTRLRSSQTSQADSAIPQVDSEVSPVSSNSSQAVRNSVRFNASQADSTISQADSNVSQASRSSSPQ